MATILIGHGIFTAILALGWINEIHDRKAAERELQLLKNTDQKIVGIMRRKV